MRTAASLFLALFPLITLTGCPECMFEADCGANPVPAPVELSDGAWLFTMDAVEARGDCAGVDARDAEGGAFIAHLGTPSEDQVVIGIDGLRLRGERWDDQVSARGDLESVQTSPPDEPPKTGDDGEPVPGDESGSDGARDSDGGAEGKCDTPESTDPMSGIDLAGTVLAPDHMVGEIIIELHEEGIDCSVAIEFDAHLADDCFEGDSVPGSDCG